MAATTRRASKGGTTPATDLERREGMEPRDGAQVDAGQLLLWSVEATAGYDAAWVRVDDRRLRAEGRAVALRPRPYWVDHELETDDGFVHRALRMTSRWEGGGASLDLARLDDGTWTVNGHPRPDLADALDCDIAACPLTNAMPILRHGLHRRPGDVTFVMAFVEVPGLSVVAVEQRYVHLRSTEDGGAVVGYRSGSFASDLTIDADGFVVDYPQLGRRATWMAPGVRPPPRRAPSPRSGG